MSLLLPRVNDRQKWLMPVMSSPHHGAHAVDGKLALYPWRNIFVRQGAEVSGDGSKASPLNDLALIFKDDALECICQALCCDCITVFVDGDISVVSQDKEGESSGGCELVAVDGQGRDYRGNLRIAPWGERLKIKAVREFSLAALDGEELCEETSLLIGVRNVSGVEFRDVDIELTLKGAYEEKVDEDAAAEPRPAPRMNVMARLHCAEGLRRCAFPGCTLSAVVKIDVSTEIGYRVYRVVDDGGGWGGLPPGWDSGGGWGGGGGGGGGGVGWGGYAPIIPPDEDEDDGGGGGDFDETDPDGAGAGWDSGKINVKCVIRCYIGCDGSDIGASRTAISSHVETSVGAMVDAAGVAASRGIYCDSFVCDSASRIILRGGGNEYQVFKDGELVKSGVEPYSLTGHGLVSGIMSSRDGVFNGVLGSCLSEVLADALNTPHSRDASTGEEAVWAVGGMSQAEAYGFRACRRAVVALADCTCEALATHPQKWLEVACPYMGNRDAKTTDSVGSDNYCHASHVDLCGNIGECYSPLE